jgi:hypothetical protein
VASVRKKLKRETVPFFLEHSWNMFDIGEEWISINGQTKEFTAEETKESELDVRA